MSEEKRRQREALRARATRLLETATTDANALPTDARELMGELQVLNAELELQQQELIESQGRAEASARHFAQLFHGAPIGFVRLDDQGLLVEYNDPAQALLHLLPLRQRVNFDSLLAPESKATWATLRGAAGRNNAAGELKLRPVGGGLVMARVTVAAWSTGGLLVSLDDVTAQRAHEREMQRTQQRLAHLVESVADGVMFVRWPEGLIDSANPAMCRALKVDAAHLMGSSIRGWFGPAVELAQQLRLEQAAATSNSNPMELTFRAHGGQTVEMECVVGAVADDRGTLLFIVARDVSARRAHERERAAMVERGMQAQKLEALGHLAAGVAHDFNNVLAAVLACVGDLRAGTPGQVKEAADDVERAAVRGRELAASLLALSRERPVRLTDCLLGEVVSEAVSLLRRSAPSNVVVREEHRASRELVQADAGQLVRVLINLGVNAFDALPNGGEVTFAVRDTETGAAIEVVDTGTGMTEEVRRAAFNPFFTTKEPGKGTGLGLAHARSVAEAHHATIDLWSELGHGTRLRLSFPLTKVSTLTPTQTDPDERHHLGLRVLVVDDDALVLRGAERSLQRIGCRSKGVASGLEALDVLASGAQFDCVMTDLSMPKMNGVELVRAVRDMGLCTPIVVVSGMLDERTEAQVRTAGANAVLHKPASDAQLVAALEAATGGLVS